MRAFEEEVRREVRPAEFRDSQALIQGLSTGVQGELERLRLEVTPHDPRVLQGRLLPNQDWIEWFDSQLAQLPPDSA